jgi:hypothetical protein
VEALIKIWKRSSEMADTDAPESNRAVCELLKSFIEISGR